MKISIQSNPVLHIEVTLNELFKNYLNSIQGVITDSEGEIHYTDFEWQFCAILKGDPNHLTDLFREGNTMMLLPSIMDEIDSHNEIVLTIVDSEGTEVLTLDENDLVY